MEIEEYKENKKYDPIQVITDARSELARAEELAEFDGAAALAAFDLILLNDGKYLI